MTNLLTIGIPTLAVLVGILLNRNDANRLGGRITTEIAGLRVRIDAVEASLRAEIATARKQPHDDVIALLGLARDQDTRLARLEAHS